MSADAYWSSPEGVARTELRRLYLARLRVDAERREVERQSQWETGEGRTILRQWRAEVKARRLESWIPERVWTRVERTLKIIWLAAVVGASVPALFKLGLVWGLLVTLAIAFASWIPLAFLTVVFTQFTAALAADRAGLGTVAVLRVLFGIESPAAPPRPKAPLRAWNPPTLPELQVPNDVEERVPFEFDTTLPQEAATAATVAAEEASGTSRHDDATSDEAWRDAHPVPTFSFSRGF